MKLGLFISPIQNAVIVFDFELYYTWNTSTWNFLFSWFWNRWSCVRIFCDIIDSYTSPPPSSARPHKQQILPPCDLILVRNSFCAWSHAKALECRLKPLAHFQHLTLIFSVKCFVHFIGLGGGYAVPRISPYPPPALQGLFWKRFFHHFPHHRRNS